MSYWVKVDGVTVAYNVDNPESSTFYNAWDKVWETANPSLITDAAEALRKQGIPATRPAEEEKPPKPKRKELMREIANLKETIDGLMKQLGTSNRRLIDTRMGELEHHLTMLNYEAANYRRIIREAGNGVTDAPTARELFRTYFHKDIEEMDVLLTPEETAKVFGNK